MKINELLNSHFRKENSVNLFNSSLTKDDIKNLLPLINECEEFENSNTLSVIEFPYMEKSNGDVVEVQNIKLSNGIRFYGKGYIYNIGVILKEPSKIVKMPEMIKNGACITPPIFSTNDLKYVKRICIEFSPEELQDSLHLEGNPKRKELIDLFNDILDNPQEYSHYTEMEFFIRGIFEKYVDSYGEYNVDLSELNIGNPTENFMIVYFDFEIGEDGTITPVTKKKYIPTKLKNDFDEFFKDYKGVLDTNKINEFLDTVKDKL